MFSVIVFPLKYLKEPLPNIQKLQNAQIKSQIGKLI